MDNTNRRFVPVRVNTYIGDYTGRFLSWAVADRNKANSIVSEKFLTRPAAQHEADYLEECATREEV